MAYHDRTVSLIHVASGRFPITVHEFTMLTPGYAWGEYVCDEFFAEHGYAVIYPTEKPQGEVVEEIHPVYVYGAWMQTWVVRDYTDAERQAALDIAKEDAYRTITARTAHRRQDGLAVCFSDGSTGHVQIREIDLIRLSELRRRAERAGCPDFMFRTVENELHRVTAEEMVDLCDRAFHLDSALLEVKWRLLEQARKATQRSEVPDRNLTWKELKLAHI